MNNFPVASDVNVVSRAERDNLDNINLNNENVLNELERMSKKIFEMAKMSLFFTNFIFNEDVTQREMVAIGRFLSTKGYAVNPIGTENKQVGYEVSW